MRLLKYALLVSIVAIVGGQANAQTKPRPAKRAPQAKANSIPRSGVVIDETLSVLRKEPSLYAEQVHRMQRGRKVQILGRAEADGVTFYKVVVPPKNYGWVQSDAVFTASRQGDEDRFKQLLGQMSGFDQIEMIAEFFSLYPDSKYRPELLLLFGNSIEAMAPSLSKTAAGRLKKGEMEASGAPIHSYYLNFNYLDRYRKLGIIFLFDPKAKQYHYDGASWLEILKRFPDSAQAADAQKRVNDLKAIMGVR
ncbi:MAG: SH3 domain-containing protein [Chloracidobacterium sp.]|nr:SH3 domain-containing protein [Chloracidobacterium sp.]MCO5333198.1 SH3 domain-containing protein [Pyrinomonadaceae bacterium]